MMKYISSWARIERQEGKIEVLLRQICKKFGHAPDWVEARLQEEDSEALDNIGLVLFDARTVDELFIS